MNKQKIQAAFDAASHSYENVAFIQKQSAQILISNLLQEFSAFSPAAILDLGTGTGYVTELLLPIFSTSSYILNDISPKMLQQAQAKFAANTNVEFYLGDLEKSHFSAQNLIISNLALQWVEHFENTISRLFNNTNILAFSCLLDGVFQEWAEFFKDYEQESPIKKYPSYEILTAFLLSLQPYKYHFEMQNFQIKFPNAKAFAIYLKALGASTSEHNISLSSFKNIIKTNNQEFEITYKIFFGILERK